MCFSDTDTINCTLVYPACTHLITDSLHSIGIAIVLSANIISACMNLCSNRSSIGNYNQMISDAILLMPYNRLTLRMDRQTLELAAQANHPQN